MRTLLGSKRRTSGSAFGERSARKPYSLTDSLNAFLALIGYSVPVFWFGQLLLMGLLALDKKTGKMPTQEEQDRWERVIPIMNELLAAKGLRKVAEGAVLVTGMKGPLEDGWQDKVAAFADQVMSTVSGGHTPTE